MKTAEEFDEIFDKGEEDVLKYADLSSVRKIHDKPHRVNIDFPGWVVNRLDREAQRLGITRQALVKVWIAERLEKA